MWSSAVGLQCTLQCGRPQAPMWSFNMGLHWVGNLQCGIPMGISNVDSNLKFHCRVPPWFSGQARCNEHSVVDSLEDYTENPLHRKVCDAFTALAEYRQWSEDPKQ